ncbi:hypothetical protein C8F04DRAFT_1186396 [Mycena alexandri]|uniref:Uncharacterized protein n=1 Tax=Mycena alexandri TaxID=1745969 RepID=A0AAD6SQY7_9AGAR|nr:hypothetical protein C8F04DRAFT_1186396 [Mycena alexandri]
MEASSILHSSPMLLWCWKNLGAGTSASLVMVPSISGAFLEARMLRIIEEEGERNQNIMAEDEENCFRCPFPISMLRRRLWPATMSKLGHLRKICTQLFHKQASNFCPNSGQVGEDLRHKDPMSTAPAVRTAQKLEASVITGVCWWLPGVEKSQ